MWIGNKKAILHEKNNKCNLKIRIKIIYICMSYTICIHPFVCHLENFRSRINISEYSSIIKHIKYHCYYCKPESKYLMYDKQICNSKKR